MSEKRTLTIYLDVRERDKGLSVLILNGIQRMVARKGETLYHFNGDAAQVVVISTIPQVDRAAALRLAAQVVGGTVCLTHVDLTELGITKHTRRDAKSSNQSTNRIKL